MDGYTRARQQHTDKSVNWVLAAADTGKDNVIAVRSANHQLFIQRIVYNPTVVAAQTVTFKDDNSSAVIIGLVAASQGTPVTFDYGPKGIALTAGKNLDVTGTAGPGAILHIEAYEKPVSGAVHTGLAATAQ